MLKTLLTIILPFFGPWIAYSIWQKLMLRKSERMSASVIAWCLLAGSVLAVLSIFIFGLQVTSKQPGAYSPPIYEDGKVVPGKFK